MFSVHCLIGTLQFFTFPSLFLRMFDFVVLHIDLMCYFGRTNTLGAYLITPAMGSHFVMYIAKMQGLVLFDSSQLYWNKIAWFNMLLFILRRKLGIRASP